jgi:hypothetical protein
MMSLLIETGNTTGQRVLIHGCLAGENRRVGLSRAFVTPEGDAVKLIGILLIVFGIVALAVGGIGYTKREKVLDLGPIQATTEKREMIPLSPIAGIAAVAAGVALVVVGSRRHA